MRKFTKKSMIMLKTIFFFFVLFFALFFGERQYEYVTSSPYDVIVSDVTAKSATISWKTRRDVSTHILLNSSKLIGNGVREKFHRVVIEDLEQQTNYIFSITNGKRTWDSSLIDDSKQLRPFVVQDYKFETGKANSELQLPSHSSLTLLPHELVYVSLYKEETGEYSDIRSGYANKYGGAVFVKENFNIEKPDNYSVRNINYFSVSSQTASTYPRVYASEINCNQNIPYLPSNAISRQAFADLATRWVSGRGKNYAFECYNDVVYRAKKAGVDPAFVLTMWLKESGASNYTWNPDTIGIIEDFGIHGKKSVPFQNFDLQIEYFLKLSHRVTCSGLSAWEAWGNNYRYGTCNANDPVQRADGIDYYQDVATLYSWVTNGSSLPNTVTGKPKIEAIPEEIFQQKCCAIKIENNDNLVGVFKNNVGNKRCEDLFPVGSNILEGKVEYAVLLEAEEKQNTCEVEYDGACCRLDNGIKWYPKYLCEDIVSDITNPTACNDYQGQKACFFRDGKFEWLPKILADDYLDNVTSERLCLERNITKTHTIKIQEGTNFIDFDFTPLKNGQNLFASDLLKMYPSLSLVANFQNYDWVDIVVSSDEIPFAGQDYEILQNSDYLLISDRDMDITIDGWFDSTIAITPKD